MYGEETNVNEKKDYDISKIPKSSDETIEHEQIDDGIKKRIMDTHSKIENIISNREIVEFYMNASPTERVELENTIISSFNDEAKMALDKKSCDRILLNGSSFIAYLKEEAKKNDLANNIRKTINNKLK